MRRFLLVSCLLLAAQAPVLARTPARALDQAVNTMAVKGSIEVAPDGKVQRYAIEHPEAYSAAIREMLDRVVPQWTFRPVQVNGQPRAVRSAMYLRLRAEPIGDGQFRVVVAGAAFGDDEDAPPGTEVAVAPGGMTPPHYPREQLIAGLGAQVVTVLKVGRDGRVEDAVVEQTNLAQLGTPKAMKRWRRDFEEAALAAVKHWKFVPPTAGPQAAEPYWSLRVPITYTPATGAPANTPGAWESYVPGPRQPVPWATDEDQPVADTALDALPRTGVFPLRPALQLLTPLNQG